MHDYANTLITFESGEPKRLNIEDVIVPEIKEEMEEIEISKEPEILTRNNERSLAVSKSMKALPARMERPLG